MAPIWMLVCIIGEIDMELLSILVGYPLGILSNATFQRLRPLMARTQVEPLQAIFLKSFAKAIRVRKKQVDAVGKAIISRIDRAAKKDPSVLWSCLISTAERKVSILGHLREPVFRDSLAGELVRSLSLEGTDNANLVRAVVDDCLQYYQSAFFSHMTEKEGIQALLLQSFQLDSLLDIFNQLNDKTVTKSQFDELRSLLVHHHLESYPEAQRSFREYSAYVRARFRYVELKGFSPRISGKEIQMRLDDIFIPLSLSSDRHRPTQSRLLQPQLKRRRGRARGFSEEDEGPERVDIITCLSRHRNLVILGDPGSGKSTLLKHLAMKVLSLHGKTQALSNLIPIYLRISDYAQYFAQTRKPLYHYIISDLDLQHSDLFTEAMGSSNALLLMDGMDEVTSTALRNRVAEQVMDLLARYPFVRFVATSRIVGYQEARLGGPCVHFRLEPFRRQEIETFSVRWYEAIARSTDRKYTQAREQGKSLFENISRNRSVTRLATNPLLMTIIALIHYRGKKLPNRRIELYDISTETFLEYWVQLRHEEGSRLRDKAEIVEIMAPIAFHIHQTRADGLIAEDDLEVQFIRQFQAVHTRSTEQEARQEFHDLVEFLRKEAGYFYEKGEDAEGKKLFGFMHLTFEEYLSAIELSTRWREKRLRIEDYVFDARWVEVIRLAAAHLRSSLKGRSGRNEATQFLRDILSDRDPFPEAFRSLQLAFLTLADDVDMSDDLVDEILKRGVNVIGAAKVRGLQTSFRYLAHEVLASDSRAMLVAEMRRQLRSHSGRSAPSGLMQTVVALSDDDALVEMVYAHTQEDSEARYAVAMIPWLGVGLQRQPRYGDILRRVLDEREQQLPEKDLVSILEKLFSFYADTSLWIFQHPDYFDMVLPFFQSLGARCREFMSSCFLIYILAASDRAPGIKQLQSMFSTKQTARNFGAAFKRVEEVGKMFKHRRRSWGPTLLSKHQFVFALGELLWLVLWRRDYAKIWVLSAETDRAEQLLTELEEELPSKELHLLTARMFEILGPRSGPGKGGPEETEDLRRFLEASRLGIIPDFFGWEAWPLWHFGTAPDDLSKVIVENALTYLNPSLDLEREGRDLLKRLEVFDDIEMIPPVRMLFQYHTRKAPSVTLVTECLDYFRTASEGEREGCFEILYRVLNPFQPGDIPTVRKRWMASPFLY